MIRRALLVLLALITAAAPAWATEMFEKVGTVGFQFLEIGAGPRGVAMGEAVVAATEGVESIFWNPAGLRSVTRPTVLFSYGTWPADITHQFVAYAMKPTFLPGVIGVSVTTLSMDPMAVRTADVPEGVGAQFDCGDMAVGLTYTRVFTDRFSAGGTLKWIHSSLGDLSVLGVEGLSDYTVDSVVADFGTLYDTGFQSLKIGLLIQNMGPEVTFIDEPVPVPTSFKFGVSMLALDSPGQQVLVAAEFRHPSDTSEKINLGAEYSLNRTYFLRAGYRIDYDAESFTAGGGAKVTLGALGRASFDYSFSDMGNLGGVHRAGVTFEF
ncbi:MAG: PorV/PorQ family protein [Candidatus Eisenbacteria bacterium]|nr:PorV/PorQ family protein [Candidatus Eisenbacteria bacterium]